MQDETQNPNADAAREPSAPDPSAANPVEAEGPEGLTQDAVAPDSAAASTPTDQGAGAFDPSVSTRTEDLTDPASPTETDPAASAEPMDRGPLGTPPPGTAEQEAGPPRAADELEPDDAASASDWGDWADAVSELRGGDDWADAVAGPGDPGYFDYSPFSSAAGEDTFSWESGGSDVPDSSATTDMIVDPVPTDQAEPLESEATAPLSPEAVSMPTDMIVDPVSTQVEPSDSEGAAAPPPLNLAEQIDPNWPVLEELNSRELLEVQDVLGDPSRLSDPEVLEDLNSDQMQAVMQALVGNLNASGTGVAEETGEGHGDAGGEGMEPGGTGVIPDAGGEGAQLPNLADQIDPNWPVLEELNSRELMEVQDVLGDPSRLSDPEVLEDLNPHQMQAVMQALVGNLNTPEPVEDAGDLIEEALGRPDDDGEVMEPGTDVSEPEPINEPVDAPDASGAAVGGAAVGGAAVGAGAAGGLGEDLLGETAQDIGEALGIGADDISEIAQNPLGAISEVAEGYLGGIVGESPIGDILEGDIGEAALGALGDSIGGPIEDILEGDIGEAVLGGLGVSIGGPLGGVIGGALGEVAEDIIEEVPVVGDVFEAVEGVTEGLNQAAEEVVDEVVEDLGEAAEEFVDDVGDFFGW